ncbi:MAG: cardiolipin synthase ClsB [Gallionella sp.]|nr:cardiolipin synthase ClsB [Gallionella sp.]
MNQTHQVAGNQLTLLQNGAEYFPQLCADIDAARHSIHLETYIFAADQAGRTVADALRRAAARGVEVCLLLDGFGAAELPAQWLDELRADGVQVLWFRRDISPFTLQRSRMRRLRRMHRKMAVIDAAVALVGGINILDDVPTDADHDAPRLDYAVRVQGDMADEVRAAMEHMWNLVTWATLRRRVKKIRYFKSRESRSPELSLLLRDNFRHRRDIEHAYHAAMAHAQHEIIMANAYFLPGRIFRRALMHAAQRGVRVVLLLQGRVEYRLQHYATRALYEQLLAAGIEIYEYQASYMHAKVAVVDGRWATIGSSNIDPLSLLLAREANLAVQDERFAGELRRSLLDAIDRDGLRIRPGDSRQTGWRSRLLAKLSHAIIRIVMAVLGYGKGSI